MKIYTSYFANWRNIPGEAVAIGVTRFKPSYWQGANLESLAPSEELLREYRNRNIDEFMFKIIIQKDFMQFFVVMKLLKIFATVIFQPNGLGKMLKNYEKNYRNSYFDCACNCTSLGNWIEPS